MITLHCFDPAPELPDFSPFVVKVMVSLRMANLDFVEKRRLSVGSPKGKLPFIEVDGKTVADSTFIRFHLEKTYGIDFDSCLSPEQKAQAWAVEKMCEEHLYWTMLYSRWMVDANFELGGSKLFEGLPAPVKPLVKWMVRRQFKRDLWGQGIGRHSANEIAELGVRDIEALSELLSDKSYLFGEAPCGADATVFAFVSGIMAPVAESSLRDLALRRENLVAYRDRMMRGYFPLNHSGEQSRI